MSTYWYFECMDHDPPISSEDEFTQHTDDKYFAHALALVQARPLPEKDYTFDDGSHEYFDNNARRFLNKHPKCNLELVDEYGNRRLIGWPEST